MSNPGEYTSPLVRKTFVNCPVISGYVTARLRRADAPLPALISGHDTLMHVTAENVTNGTIAFVLQATDDRSISGARTTLINTGCVAGGHDSFDINTNKLYLEVYGAAGPGYLRLQIDSLSQWHELGFAKDDPFYPPQLFQARPVLTS